MEEFGRFLKEERLARGIALSTVQVQTRIRTAYLESIEAGDFASLPGNTYARAFLKLYANAIGLDAEDIVERYDALRGEAPSQMEEFKPPARERLARRRRKRRLQMLQWTGILVILLAVIFFGREWLLSSNSEPVTHGLAPTGEMADQNGPDVLALQNRGATDGPADETPAGDDSGEIIPPDTEEPPPGDASQFVEDDTPLVDQGGPEEGPGSSSSEANGINQDELTENEENEAAIPAWAQVEEEAEIDISLTFEGLSWTGVWVDGERVLYQDVPGGTEVSWTGQESVRVRLGRGESVRITLNGEDLGLAGSGIVDREFTVESVLALRRQED